MCYDEYERQAPHRMPTLVGVRQARMWLATVLRALIPACAGAWPSNEAEFGLLHILDIRGVLGRRMFLGVAGWGAGGSMAKYM